MYHLRACDPADPLLHGEDGQMLSRQGLLDRYSMVLLGALPDGRLLFDCGRVSYRPGDGRHAGLPGEKVGPEGYCERGIEPGARGRYNGQEADCLRCAYRVQVVRAPEVRKRAKAAGSAPARSPVGEGKLPEVDHPAPDPPEVVARAVALPDAEILVLPIVEIIGDEVVVDHPQPAHRWAGES